MPTPKRPANGRGPSCPSSGGLALSPYSCCRTAPACPRSRGTSSTRCFVGGSTGYKLSEAAYAFAAEARSRGKWVHMGRVNSLQRLRAARLSLFYSVDGTYLKHGPDVLLPRLYGWLDAVNGQSALAEVVA